MRSAIRFAARLLYPRKWRERYGREFDALLEDTPATFASLIDVASGGLVMRVRMSQPAAMPMVLGLAGALMAGLAAFALPAKFEAHGTIEVTNTTGTDVDTRVPALFTAAMNRTFAAGEVSPREIGVNLTNNAREVQVTYATGDPHRARDVVQRVIGGVVEANLRDAVAGSPPMTVRVRAPVDLPRTPLRPHFAWLTIGGLTGVVIGFVVGRRRRTS